MWWKFKHGKRKYPPRYRFKVQEEGAIIAGWWREHRPCIVHDISAGGAGVELQSDEPLPHVLTLYLPSMRVSAKVRMVWQRGRRAGFQFLE